MIDTAELQYFASSFMSIITGISLYKVIKSQMNVYSTNKMITTISQAQIKQADDELPLQKQIIIKGKIGINEKDTRNEKITRTDDQGTQNNYILYIRYIESMYSNQKFEKKDDYVINLREMLGKCEIEFNPSFCIEGKNRNLVVNGYDSIDYSPILDITKWEQKRRDLSVSEQISVAILTSARAFGELFVKDRKRPSFLRGLEVGTRQIETGIKVGGSIMALGTVGMTTEGQFFIEPHMLFRDRLSIITRLKEQLTVYEQQRNFWGVVLIVGAIYLGRRIYLYNKRNNIITQIRGWFSPTEILYAQAL